MLKAQIGPRVQIIERALEPDDYLALLRDADLMLLPYDPRAIAMRDAAPAWRATHNPAGLLDVLLGIRQGL